MKFFLPSEPVYAKARPFGGGSGGKGAVPSATNRFAPGFMSGLGSGGNGAVPSATKANAGLFDVAALSAE